LLVRLTLLVTQRINPKNVAQARAPKEVGHE
jgi:hypothetical protein